MSDLIDPISAPTKAAYQLTLEMIRAGAFRADSHGGERKGNDAVAFFNIMKDRFKQLKSE